MKLINALPPAPSPVDNQNAFNNKAFALVEALDDFVSDTNEVVTELNSLSQTVSNNANAAADSKTQAQNFSVSAKQSSDLAKQSSDQAALFAQTAVNSSSTQATSTTTVTIGTGLKNLTITQSGKSFLVGQFVQVVNGASSWMIGVITSFNVLTREMVVDVVDAQGTGDISYWVITPSNPPSIVTPQARGGQVFWDQPGDYTWVVPAGVYRVFLTLVGGGGGGAGSISSAPYLGGGGGPGGVIYRQPMDVAQGDSFNIYVGAGGAGGIGSQAGGSYSTCRGDTGGATQVSLGLTRGRWSAARGEGGACTSTEGRGGNNIGGGAFYPPNSTQIVGLQFGPLVIGQDGDINSSTAVSRGGAYGGANMFSSIVPDRATRHNRPGYGAGGRGGAYGGGNGGDGTSGFCLIEW